MHLPRTLCLCLLTFVICAAAIAFNSMVMWDISIENSIGRVKVYPLNGGIRLVSVADGPIRTANRCCARGVQCVQWLC